MKEYSFIEKGDSMPKTEQQCNEIKKQTRKKILHDSMLYFARNGFAGTKISELAKHIGIGQGTLYLYFASKEDLFQEIQKMIEEKQDIKEMKLLAHLPISAKKKIMNLSKTVLARLSKDENFAGMIALNTQMMLEQDCYNSSSDTTYQSELYKCTAAIIEQGQKEGTVVTGNAMKLADYYWGVVYLYALKKLFTTQYEMIEAKDLSRTLLVKGE